jgi:hypothetical protein
MTCAINSRAELGRTHLKELVCRRDGPRHAHSGKREVEEVLEEFADDILYSMTVSGKWGSQWKGVVGRGSHLEDVDDSVLKHLECVVDRVAQPVLHGARTAYTTSLTPFPPLLYLVLTCPNILRPVGSVIAR